MNTGWIKLHRKALAHITKPMTEFESWLWLLCKTGYGGDDRGKILTTYSILADEWGIGKGAARWRIAKWIKDGMIKARRITRNQIDLRLCNDPTVFSTLSRASGAKAALFIEVANYDHYQSDGGKDSTSQSTLHSTSSENHSLKKNKKEVLPAPAARAQNKEGKRQTKAKSSSLDSRHQEVVDFFYTEFKKKFKRDYVGQKKDFAAISRLLKKIDADDLMDRIQQYLKDDEPFVVNNGHNIALLQTRINAYGPKIKKSSDDDYLERTY